MDLAADNSAFDLIETQIETHIDHMKRLIRRTQLLLPLALKVAKSDFEPWIAEQFANDQGSGNSRGVLFLSLASCSAIHGSKSYFDTFNAGGKSNWVRLMSVLI